MKLMRLAGFVAACSGALLFTLLVALAPGTIASWGACNWERAVGGTHGQDIAMRGALLRYEIDRSFKWLVDKRSFQWTGARSDITPAVRRYIPGGFTLEDDKLILQCAGFTINPGLQGSITLAEIDPYWPGSGLACRATVTTLLEAGSGAVAVSDADIHAVCF